VELLVRPIALGAGRALFDGVPAPLQFSLASARQLGSAGVALRYVAAR